MNDIISKDDENLLQGSDMHTTRRPLTSPVKKAFKNIFKHGRGISTEIVFREKKILMVNL